ncbi:MAG: hypothetical protein ACI845_002490, partial [Gammaproteobacteria bacterium]
MAQHLMKVTGYSRHQIKGLCNSLAISELIQLIRVIKTTLKRFKILTPLMWSLSFR